MQVLWQDLRYAVRVLARNAGFATVAVLTMALGIGATSSIYSVVDAVLLRPLAYPEPDRIVEVARQFRGGQLGVQDAMTFSVLRERYASCEYVAATIGSSKNLVIDKQPGHVRTLEVSADYFEVLGVEPAFGREFSPDDERLGAPLSVVLSYDLWRSRFRGDEGVLGDTVVLGGELHTLVGVMPPTFRSFPQRDAWTPLRLDFRGAGINYQVLGHLRSDVTPSQAQAELEVLAESLREEGSGLPEGQRLVAIGLQERLAIPARTELLVLLGAVGMVLLIACANTACLLLARASGRRKEVGVRVSLGGGRWRIMRQLLTESVVLGLAGGALGLLFAQWGAQGLVALSPTDYSNWNVGVDLRVAFATFAAAGVAGIFFGLAPSLQALRGDLRSALHEGGGRTASGGRARSRSALVIFEVALCTVLLIGAGLLIRTYLNLRNVELGFDPSNVLTARMSLEGAEYESADNVAALYQESLARITKLPGVEGAAVVSDLPVERGLNLPIRIPHGADAGEITSVDWRYASPGYFRTMRIPLLRGRYIEETDTADSTPVAIVNQEFVQRFFGDDDPLGAHVEVHRFSKEVDDRPRLIVGVVGDVKTRGLAGPALATMFVPVAQLPDGLLKIVQGYSGADWVVRTLPGVEVGPAVRETIASLDSQQVFQGTRTMDQIIESSLGDQRFQSTLLAVFAGLALAMASAGIYGLVAYAVSQRTREMGIRMALGATAETVVGTIVRQGIILGAVGVVLGVVVSFALTRVLQGFVFGVSTSDPATFAAVGALLVATAAVASLIPALSVLRLDPAATLRNE